MDNELTKHPGMFQARNAMTRLREATAMTASHLTRASQIRAMAAPVQPTVLYSFLWVWVESAPVLTRCSADHPTGNRQRKITR